MIVKSVHGPVDLSKPENVVRGMVFEYGHLRLTVDDPASDWQMYMGSVRWSRADFLAAPGCRFVGIDTQKASAGDVARLCCGNDDAPGFGHRCTLAIGDHAEHEDLSSGLKWAATSPPKRAGVTWTYPDAGAVVGVDRAMVPAPTLRAMLREFEGQPREHDRHARGVRVLAYVETQQRARDLAKHLQTLGGTWHPGQRRVQWPGGSSLYMMGRDDENRVRGMRVDAIVGNWPYHDSARAALVPWGLRLQVSGGAAPEFWGEERRCYSGNVRSADTSMLVDSLEETGFVDSATLAAAVMAGTPRRTSGLLYADAVAAERFGQPGPRTLTLSRGTIRIGERDVDCEVRRTDGGLAVRFEPPQGWWDTRTERYVVTVGGEKVTGLVLGGSVDAGPFDRPAAVLDLREIPDDAQPPIDPRRAAWLDDVTRRMLATRKAAASETATRHNAEALLLSKALRSALADVDRLPWDLADRKPLHAAAHALCEMAEAATDGRGHDGPKLRPMLGEMLGILRAAALLPPATAAGMAERTLGAARKAMPRRQK